MKIIGINLENHPVLGNQKAIFKTPDGNICEMVIMAGENGAGKSTFMDLIHDFCNLKIPLLGENESREITIYLDLSEINGIRYPDEKVKCLNKVTDGSIIIFGFNSKISRSQPYFYIKVGEENISVQKDFLKSRHAKRILGSIYMDHDLNRNIKGFKITNSNSIWTGRRSSEGSGFNTELGLIQLYFSADQERIYQRKVNKELAGIDRIIFNKILELPINSAIKQLLPNTTIHGLAPGKKKLLVKKNDKTFEYKNLSSGEKQILGITSFLTYDFMYSSGAPILIDEPENNLHPDLQLKMRSYFRKLFPKNYQIFIATHSPFIIHDESKKNERIFMFKRGKNNVVISDFGEFHSCDHQRKVNEIFNIKKLYNQIEQTPTILVEGETDEIYLNLVKNLFFKNKNFIIKWVGYYAENNNPVFTGSSALDKIREVMAHKPNLITQKLMLLYDCDVQNIKSFSSKNFFIQKLPHNPSQNILNKGIENALIIPSSVNINDFYKEKTHTKDYGESTTTKSFMKMEFCQEICSREKNELIRIFEFLRVQLNSLIETLNL